MKAWTGFIAVCLLVLGIISYSPKLAFNPGELSEGHIKETKGCVSCHVAFQGATDEKCQVCHKEIDFAKKDKLVFHNKLQSGNCQTCHLAHTESKPRPFEHSLLPANIEKDCANCHKVPKDSLHQKNVSNCTSCHNQKAFKPATFEHSRFFRFDRHHPETCENCHKNNDYSNYTCYNCHEHSPSNIRGEHIEEGIYQFDDCAGCHPSGNEHDARKRPGSNRSKPSLQNEYRQRIRPAQPDWRRERKHDDDDDDDDDDDHDDHD